MTDEERAQVIREEVERAMSDMPNGWISDVANRLREQADLLDPPEPEPEPEPGTVVWWRLKKSNDRRWRIGRFDYDGTGEIVCLAEQCVPYQCIEDIEWKPAHTLEPGSVVLSLAEAEQILPALPLTSPISRIVCGAIAKAEQELKND